MREWLKLVYDAEVGRRQKHRQVRYEVKTKACYRSNSRWPHLPGISQQALLDCATNMALRCLLRDMPCKSKSQNTPYPQIHLESVAIATVTAATALIITALIISEARKRLPFRQFAETHGSRIESLFLCSSLCSLGIRKLFP